ncbi:MAG: fatty acid desaturase family protein [Devosia sp.]
MFEALANLPAHSTALRRWLGRPAWPTVLASGVIVSVYAASLGLVTLGAMPLWAGAMVSFFCIHSGFTILHEASHRAISGGVNGLKWLDSLPGAVHAGLLAYDYPIFRFIHLRHHAHTNDPEKDPDYWMQGMSAPMATLLGLFVPLHYLHLYIRAVRRAEVSPGEAVATALRLGLLLALVTLGLALTPVETLCLWLIPAACASAMLSLAHRMLHAAEISSDRLKTTIIIKGEGIWEWIICPLFWLNNHHLLHHESPRLPVYSHGSVFASVEDQLAAAGAKIVRVGKRRRQP